MTAPNPFEVLHLDPSAGEEEIVRQGGLLRQRAADEETLTGIRQAVQALTADPQQRQLLALLTHPRPEYRSPVLERLAGAFRRAPAPTGVAAPDLDLDEFMSQVIEQVVKELESPPTAFEPVTAAADQAEIGRLLAEALWQSMLCDMRA
jgi:hypothetical protein